MLAESIATTAAENFNFPNIPGPVDAIEALLEYNENTYFVWMGAMKRWGYTWEAHKVPTEDGFTLTTFHITGKVGSDGETITRDATEPPVLVQHGLGSDAATWLWSYRKGVPLPLQLYDAGFDVWMGNSRGTEYSQEHATLKTTDDEYWLYDWAEMGKYDAPAQITKVKEQTGWEKILYLGYSQGTTQMFYGLSKFEESFYADNLLKFGAFAPCIRFKADSEKYWKRTEFRYAGMGIYHEGGPYQVGNIEKICTHMPWNCKLTAEKIMMQPSSIQSTLHYAQCAIEKRFQEYSPTYENGDKQTALIPLDSIDKIPIAMWVGGQDNLCPLD